MRNKKKIKKDKEPSLFRKIIEIHFEQARRQKVIRQLQKQSWSFDFLALLLVKASQVSGQNLSLSITDREGVTYTLAYDKAKQADSVHQLGDTIFDHLDDDIAVANFITKNSRR